MPIYSVKLLEGDSLKYSIHSNNHPLAFLIHQITVEVTLLLLCLLDPLNQRVQYETDLVGFIRSQVGDTDINSHILSSYDDGRVQDEVAVVKL